MEYVDEEDDKQCECVIDICVGFLETHTCSENYKFLKNFGSLKDPVR
jgi:hypothetical protein